MKSKLRIIVVMIFILSAFFMIACNGDEAATEELIAPKENNQVQSIVIKHNDKIIGGTLSVDLSSDTIVLNASAVVSGNPSFMVEFSSENSDVAYVSSTNSNRLVLKSPGETVITAKAGDVETKIVLIVSNSTAPNARQYTVTVIDGTSNISSASEGQFVALKAAQAPIGQKFKNWEYYDANNKLISDLWVNGNLIKMLKGDIIAKATFEKIEYNLIVESGKAEVNGVLKEGVVISENRVSIPCYYEDQIKLIADQTSAGKAFVGWDEGVKNNRITHEEKEINVTMPAKNILYSAVFSDALSMGLATSTDTSWNDSTGPQVTGTGVWSAELISAGQPEFEGMSGITLNIQANAATDSFNRIRGSKLSNISNGSRTITYIFRNRSAVYPITVELVAESYGAKATSGEVTIPAGGSKKVTKVVSHGFVDPYMIIYVRQAIGGNSNESVMLDIVGQQADTYPDGDPRIEIKDAVTIKGAYGRSNASEKNAVKNDSLGMLLFYGLEKTGTFHVYGQINNIIELADGENTTTIYFRLISNIELGLAYKFKFGTSANNDSLGSRDVNLIGNAVEVFAINIDRSTNPSEIFFTLEGSNINVRQNFVVQMSYSNVFGIEEA